MCSAYENVYFQDEGFNIEALHHKAAPFRRQRKSNVDIFPGEETENRKQEFIATSLEEIRTNLRLSIMRITKKTKKWRDGFRKLKMQPAVVVRDEKMANDYDEFLKKVDGKEYKRENFIKFLAEKCGQTQQL